MSQQFEKTIFGTKKFSDLLEEIYNNQKRREAQVTALISELKPMVSDIGDATLIVPLIKEYMEIGVKNDDALIKMATLVQRALNSTSNDGELGISDEEKAQLLEEMEKRFAELENKEEFILATFLDTRFRGFMFRNVKTLKLAKNLLSEKLQKVMSNQSTPIPNEQNDNEISSISLKNNNLERQDTLEEAMNNIIQKSLVLVLILYLLGTKMVLYNTK